MNRLERWRLDRNMSYDDMHKKLGISNPNMICKWCMHPDHPSYQMPNENERMVIQMMTLGEIPANAWSDGQSGVHSNKPKGVRRNGRKQ